MQARWILRVLTWMWVGLAAGAVVVAHTEPTQPAVQAEFHGCVNRYCAPDPSPEATRLISHLEARGLHCSPRAASTDHVVFQDRQGRARVATLAQAWAAGQRGAGWSLSFCT